MNVRIQCYILLPLCLALSIPLLAQHKRQTSSTSSRGPHELAGFQLGQIRSTLARQYGEPFKVHKDDDGWLYEHYLLQPDTSQYLLAETSPDDTLRVNGLRLNGTTPEGLHDFLGLQLGDPVSKAKNLLGKPSKTIATDLKTVRRWDYQGKNYYLEVYNDETIYGFGIFRSEPTSTKGNDRPDFSGFRKAIIDRNPEQLLNILMPDFEIYRADSTFSYSRAARMEIEDLNSPVSQLLLGIDGSVRSALMNLGTVPDPEQRPYSNGQNGWVYRFPESSMLRELVFTKFDGEWRVWEIAFRNPASGE